MSELRLYQGEPNPNDVVLRDWTAITATSSVALPFGSTGVLANAIAAASSVRLPFGSTGTATNAIAAASVVALPFGSTGTATNAIAASSAVALPFGSTGTLEMEPVPATEEPAPAVIAWGTYDLPWRPVQRPEPPRPAPLPVIHCASRVRLPFGSTGRLSMGVAASSAVALPFRSVGAAEVEPWLAVVERDDEEMIFALCGTSSDWEA